MPVEKGKPAVMLGRKATVPPMAGGCVTKEAKVHPKKSLLGFFVAKRKKR